jgi:excisionase family DNA binding protein
MDYKVSEVAKLLNCHKRMVYEMISVGVLKSYKLGKHSIRITKEEVERIRQGN